ncbi:MAG: corrinoid protein [Candidatus Bathyarchaeota archaeon]
MMSDNQAILDKLSEAIVELDIDSIVELCESAIESGIQPYDIVINGMAKGMEIVGQKYEAGEYYLAELIMAGETMKEGMTFLEPHLAESDMKKAGTCIVGTVKGDLHDIGKNVFVSLLKAQNYEVIDLGVDISPEQFIEAVKEHKPNLVAMSALLTTTMVEMENVVKQLKEAGIRDSVKIIIGGAPLNQKYATGIGADAAATDAVEGIRIINGWR